MKSADFKRGDSKIRVLEEVRPAPKKLNWDRLIYLAVLLLILALCMAFVFRKNMYLHGEGQILFKKLDIQFTQDIQIVEFRSHEGDSVEIGDTLFFYYDENGINNEYLARDQRTVQVISNDNLDWIIRERIATEKKIALEQLEISKLDQLLTREVNERHRIQKEVYLDIYPVSKLEAYDHRILNYRSGIEAGKKEITYLKVYLGHLREQERIEIEQEKLKQASQAILPKRLHAHVSPVKGTVTQIMKENHEVALESHVIMSIHKPTNLYIKAFYDQGDLHYLKEGDVVDVLFPDGTKSYGVLQRFYFATYELPEEFQKKYEPTTRSIVADITPIDQLELEKWKAFYKLNVHVTKALF